MGMLFKVVFWIIDLAILYAVLRGGWWVGKKIIRYKVRRGDFNEQNSAAQSSGMGAGRKGWFRRAPKKL